MSELRAQAQKVLRHLERFGADTETNIATFIGSPAPSVRRSIQELIRAGYNVTYAGASGLYTYTEAK